MVHKRKLPVFGLLFIRSDKPTVAVPAIVRAPPKAEASVKFS